MIICKVSISYLLLILVQRTINHSITIRKYQLLNGFLNVCFMDTWFIYILFLHIPTPWRFGCIFLAPWLCFCDLLGSFLSSSDSWHRSWIANGPAVIEQRVSSRYAYRNLCRTIVAGIESKQPAVANNVTLEIVRFVLAALESERLNGEPVALGAIK